MPKALKLPFGWVIMGLPVEFYILFSGKRAAAYKFASALLLI